MQLIGYLYDVDALGIGTLITHGLVTRYDAAAVSALRWTLNCWPRPADVPAGHRVAIAFDTLDLLYALRPLISIVSSSSMPLATSPH